MQVYIRRSGGIARLVQLLDYGPESEITHRVLLALRIIIYKEVDRFEIMRSGGVSRLVSMLEAGPDSEVRYENNESI